MLKITDGRKLDASELSRVRRQAVAMVQAGESPEKVVARLGISRAAIYNWLARYRAEGSKALEAKKRGGRPRKLSESDLQRLLVSIARGDPRQLEHPSTLWTRETVKALVAAETGIKLSKSSTGRLLREFGITPPPPTRRALHRNRSRPRKSLRQEFRRIVEQAKVERAAVFLVSETKLSAEFHRKSGRAIATAGKRNEMRAICATSPRGDLQFMVVERKIDETAFLEFVDRLMQDPGRPLFLILNGKTFQPTKRVHRLVNSFQGRLRLHCLPPEFFETTGVKRNPGRV